MLHLIFTLVLSTSAPAYATDASDCRDSFTSRPLAQRFDDPAFQAAVNWASCLEVAHVARQEGASRETVRWLIALSGYESDHNRLAVGSSGERSQIQVMHFHCPTSGGCDRLRSGVRHFMRLAERGGYFWAAAAWNGGHRDPNDRYALNVERRLNMAARARRSLL